MCMFLHVVFGDVMQKDVCTKVFVYSFSFALILCVKGAQCISQQASDNMMCTVSAALVQCMFLSKQYNESPHRIGLHVNTHCKSASLLKHDGIESLHRSLFLSRVTYSNTIIRSINSLLFYCLSLTIKYIKQLPINKISTTTWTFQFIIQQQLCIAQHVFLDMFFFQFGPPQ